MPRKKGSQEKQEKKDIPQQIDSFAALAEELQLNESYKSLLLGIAVVLLVTVMIFAYIKNRPQSTPPVTEIATSEVEEPQNILGVHTVHAGEDLKSIAVKYYETPEFFMVIAKENAIANPDVIEEGKKLTIPKVDNKQYLAPYMSRPVKTAEIPGTSYTVEEGDLLWDIAIRAYDDGKKWKDIMTTNNLQSADAIFPGMILQLPR